MKKLFLLILILAFSNQIFGQSYSDLKKVLKIQLSKDSLKDGGWVYYADNANIEKVDAPLAKAVFPEYDFFSVTLTNYLGYHVNQGTCLILYDSSKAKILLVEPIWYSGISENLIKPCIGKKFETKESLLNFLNGLNELMEIGSVYKFVNTIVSDSLITYDLVYFEGDSYTTGGNGISSTINYNEDGVWRKIKIEIKDMKIIRYVIINPKMGIESDFK